MKARIIVHRANALVATRWKNDGGATREIAAYPLGSGFDDFTWRVSIADVETDGPFSRFEGIDRTIVLLDGAGMSLTFNDASEHVLKQAFVPFEFVGEAQVSARLIDGATQDFNLMIRRTVARGKLTVMREPGAFALASDVRMVFVARGSATLGLEVGLGLGLGQTTLGVYDAAVFYDSVEDPIQAVVSADSIVFAVHIEEIDEPAGFA
jgi:environmental stress-induced protein Ves